MKQEMEKLLLLMKKYEANKVLGGFTGLKLVLFTDGSGRLLESRMVSQTKN